VFVFWCLVVHKYSDLNPDLLSYQKRHCFTLTKYQTEYQVLRTATDCTDLHGLGVILVAQRPKSMQTCGIRDKAKNQISVSQWQAHFNEHSQNKKSNIQ